MYIHKKCGTSILIPIFAGIIVTCLHIFFFVFIVQA